MLYNLHVLFCVKTKFFWLKSDYLQVANIACIYSGWERVQQYIKTIYRNDGGSTGSAYGSTGSAYGEMGRDERFPTMVHGHFSIIEYSNISSGWKYLNHLKLVINNIGLDHFHL